MAKEPEIDPEEIVEEETPKAKRSPLIYILLGLVSLVLLEVMALALILPAMTRVEKLDPSAYEAPDYTAPGSPIPDSKPIDLVEKELGERFNIEDLSPDAQGTISTFGVKVVVAVEKKDETKFDELYAQKTNAIRADVGAVLRASTLTERSQETLGTIRNKLRVKINERLGANYVKEVICTDPKIGSM